MKKYNFNKEKAANYCDTAWAVAESVVEYMNSGDYEDMYECICDEIDKALMYWDDQLELMKYYQKPAEANFQNAIECLIEDIYSLIDEEA